MRTEGDEGECIVLVSVDARFSTGGDEKLVKVWGYGEGEVTHVGVGHSGNITSVRICPKGRYIITSSADGAILRWRYPHTS